MDQNVLSYIKKMFAMEATPTWSPDYEGVIFYDKTLKRWVIGRNDGWQIIDRRFKTFQELPNIEWIDPFEYDTDEYLRSKWVTSSGTVPLTIHSDTSTSGTTYGNYSMRIDALISGSINHTVSRTFDEPINCTRHNVLKFDTKASRIGKNLEFSLLYEGEESYWLDDWAYRIPFTIDHTKIDADLTHFPVPITISGTDAEAIMVELSGGAVTAKSVIFDIEDNWGDSGYTGIRQVDFYLSGVKITVTSGFTAYASFYYSGGPPDKAFNTSTLKTGDYWNQGFLSSSTTNIRLICVFDSAIDFDKIKINNHHYYGGELTRGSKNVKITISSDTITNTTYNAVISNSELIFNGQFDQHVASDVEDEQIIELYLPTDNKKIAIGLPDQSQLYCEIEQWDVVNNKITLWTSRADWIISSTEDTTLYLYYDGVQDDNTTYVGYAGDIAAQNVWNSDFSAVYTMAQDPSGGAGCIIDSTVNENHGTSQGSMTSEDLIDGAIGKAIKFDGSDDCIVTNFTSYPNELSFIYTYASTAVGAAYHGWRDGTPRVQIRHNTLNAGEISPMLRDGTDKTLEGVASIGSALTDGEFHRLLVYFNQADDEIVVWFDGISKSIAYENQQTPTLGVSNGMAWGARHRPDSGGVTDYEFEGAMQHVCIINTLPSDAWIKADYHTQTNTLLTSGMVQDYSGAGSVLSSITKTINHSYLNTWQKELINVTTNSGTYNKIEFKILNDDADNTIYIDSMSFGMPDIYWIDSFEYPTDGILRNNWAPVVEKEIPWTPEEISTALWLDAADSSTITESGGAVSAFSDKSGNSRNFSQATTSMQPTTGVSTKNGLNVLDFAANCLTSDDTPSVWKFLHDATKSSVFAVAQFGDIANPEAVYPLMGTSAGTSGNAGYAVGYEDRPVVTGANDASMIQVGNGSAQLYGRVVWNFGGTDNPIATEFNNLIPAGQFNVVGWLTDPGNATPAARGKTSVNGGNLLGNNEWSATLSTANPTHTLQIGAFGNNVLPMTGKVAEIIIVSGLVDTDTRQKIEGYLAWKWGLEATLPSWHPYESAAPTQEIQAYSDVIEVYTDNSSPTYGNFSLRAEAVISGSKTYGFEKEFTQDIALRDYNSLCFDTKSNRVGENVEFSMSVEGPSDWLGDWAYRIPFTIDHTKIDADLTHFPVPITLSGTDAEDIITEVGSNDKKIAVTLIDNSQLYCEIEQWDTVNDKITLWASRADWIISSTADTTLYLYYDTNQENNTDYIGESGDTAAQNVWNNDFAAVYTMAQDPSGGANCIIDSTGNANHGTPNGSMTSANLVNGEIGKAIDFDGVNDYINFSGLLIPEQTYQYTQVALIKTTKNGDQQHFFAQWNISSSHINHNFAIDGSGFLYIDEYPPSGGAITAPVDITDGNYHYVACSRNGTSVKLYVDGVLALDSSSGETYTGDTPTDSRIGFSTVPSRWFQGQAALFSILITDLSADWIKADYHAQTNTLLTAGEIEDINSSTLINTPISKNIHHNDLNVWQKECIDLSSLFDTSLFYIRKIAFNILNDDLDNTFYIDSMYLSDFQPPIEYISGSLWTPTEITTALWLDAADSGTITLDGSNNVEQWDDKSGNAYSFSQPALAARPTQGTQNLKNTVAFGGSEKLVCDQAASNWAYLHNNTTEYTIFAVLKAGTSTDPDAYMPYFSTCDQTVSQKGAVFSFDDRGGLGRDRALFAYVSGQISPATVSGYANNSLTGNTWGVVMYGLDLDAASADRLVIRCDGTIYADTMISAGSVGVGDPTNTAHVGGAPNYSYGLSGELAEFIIVAGVISTNNREKIEGYLAWKWGLETNLPDGHPYKTVAPYS
jgi:hypothetical protein